MTPRIFTTVVALAMLAGSQPALASVASGTAVTVSRIAATSLNTQKPKASQTHEEGAERLRALKKSAEVTARYSEAGGKFLVHLLEHAKPGPLLPLSDPR